MKQWDDLAVFLAALRAGSVTRAATDLGVGITTVSRRLERLEAELGQPLFARTSAGLAPLPAAEALRPHAEEAERSVHAGRAALTALDPRPRGTVTVSLPTDMTNLVLLPVLARLIDAHPELQLVFDQGTEVRDLMRRESDIAVRGVRPDSGEELVSTRLRAVGLGVFGSERYLREHPSRDPGAHRWIAPPEGARLPENQWIAQAAVEARVVLRSAHGETVRQAAAAGVGLVLIPHVFGQVTPTLREVALDGPPLPVFDLWLVTHRALRHAPRVAVVWDWLVDRLREATADGLENGARRLRAELAEVYGIDFTTANQSSS
ncbi:MAG: LysR family transcriptional regulator [Myxococcota bacterium]